MYHNMARWFVKWLHRYNPTLQEEAQQEICAYGIEITLSTAVNFLLLLVLGFLLHDVISACIFAGVFITLRHYTGGYHCTTYFRCNLTFSALFLVVTLLSKLLLRWIDIRIGDSSSDLEWIRRLVFRSC